ncbi:uncharacterized protein LOC103491228 isoform X1 [Cucumis melo]|uniref:Uncharacterized protein LOC103491228 isoform X1 n=1 Tax=Cucumis melo TaxID=3656 RepID=A0ABM3L5J5_CUCME|nr:uncharacterized protein LOC103491228 isoform X1 [Cucumis melo]
MGSLPFGLLQAPSQSPSLSPHYFSFSKSETLGTSLRASSTASLAISTPSSPSSIPAEAIRKRREESGSIIRMEMYVPICFLEFLFVFDEFLYRFLYFEFCCSGGKMFRRGLGTRPRGEGLREYQLLLLHLGRINLTTTRKSRSRLTSLFLLASHGTI